MLLHDESHDILIPLNDDFNGVTALKIGIARVCELSWIQNEANAENYVTQLIPFLLLIALGPNSCDADVKRVFTIRRAFNLLDFEDSSIESIRVLILRCYIHPVFLKVAEGRRFLSFVFSLSAGLHPFVVSVMKPQIASGTVSSAYGEVLLRTWRDFAENEVINSNFGGGNEFRSAVEDIFQTFARDAILAADRKYFRSSRVMLSYIHEAKNTKGVDSMLWRCYSPIIWRLLQAPNAVVRAQAAVIFFDAFPLTDPLASAVELDKTMQKQFSLLSSLLKDGDQRVRAAAASGVCHVLRDCWALIPSVVTKQILRYLVGELALDSSCASVRLAVICGLRELLENPLTHGVLKGLLSVLSNVIHDSSERVRVAFIKLLCQIKTIRGIRFYEIVSVEHLLGRFAADADRPNAWCECQHYLVL